MLWKTPRRTFDLSQRALIMGVLNVTEDSFSDGGRFLDPDAAVARALQMEAEGAEIIDIGGESTRPGARPVPVEEELARVIPVLERLARLREAAEGSPSGMAGKPFRAAISIDTSKAVVARTAMVLGAEIINDVTALRGDPAMPSVALETGAAVVLMHMQGTPQTMQQAPSYAVESSSASETGIIRDDVTAHVRRFFAERWAAAKEFGISEECIAFDPGIGFGKTAAHNLTLIQQLSGLLPEEIPARPLLLGVSRKSFLAKVTGETALEARLWPTVALTSFARELGVRVFRVHDVRPNTEALRMTEAILNPCC